MRNYLYLWNRPAERTLVASGIEFRDFRPALAARGGVVLLRSRFGNPVVARPSRLRFVPADRMPELAACDIYGFGDFAWVDFAPGATPSEFSPEDVARLRRFAKHGQPEAAPAMVSVGNHFMAMAHDDGWFLRLSYLAWSNAEAVLRDVLLALVDEATARATLDRLAREECAVWVRRNLVVSCSGTEDIDGVLNERL